MKKYPKQAEILNKLLVEKNISKASLAKQTGISPASITYYCNGEKMMSLSNATKIASVLGVSLDYLATGQPQHYGHLMVTEEEYALVNAFRKWYLNSSNNPILPGSTDHLFLRGTTGIDKSEMIQKEVLPYLPYVGGFYTQNVQSDGKCIGYALNPVREDQEYILVKERDEDNSKRLFIYEDENGQWIFDNTVFEQYGTQFLQDSLERHTQLNVLDQTGGLELLCPGFNKMLYEALNTTPCIGVYKSIESTKIMAQKMAQANQCAKDRLLYLNTLTKTFHAKILDVTLDNSEDVQQSVQSFVKSHLY